MTRASSGNGRLSARAKLDRDRQIAVDRARGLRWQTIAQRHRLTVRQCQNVFKEQRAESVATEDPPSVVDEILEQLDALIEEAALLGEKTTNDAVHLGSINSRFKLMETRFRVMQAAGLMPSMGAIAHELETRAFVRLMIDYLDEKIGSDTDWKRDFSSRLHEARSRRADLLMELVPPPRATAVRS